MNDKNKPGDVMKNSLPYNLTLLKTLKTILKREDYKITCIYPNSLK